MSIMKFWKRKIWSPLDIACLKWSNILFGVIVGAFIPGIIRQYLWIFIVVVILLAIKPLASYLRDDP